MYCRLFLGSPSRKPVFLGKDRFRDNRLLGFSVDCPNWVWPNLHKMPQNYWSERFCWNFFERIAALAHTRGTGGLVRRSCVCPRRRRGPRQPVEVWQRGGLSGALRAHLRVNLLHFNGLKSLNDGARRWLQRVQARAKIQISPIFLFSRWIAHIWLFLCRTSADLWTNDRSDSYDVT